MQPSHFSCISRSPADTATLARQLGPRLIPGDCMLLSGPIGSGKTHFARQMIQHLQDQPEDVPSPTYTLVQIYDTSQGEIWHADLYRLGNTDEIEELGLSDAFDAAICLIEWPDRLADLSPPDALDLTFRADAAAPDTRLIDFRWTEPKWHSRLKGLL